MKLRHLLLTVVLVSSAAGAQSNEVSLSVGIYATRHVQVKNDQMFVFQARIARRVLQTPTLALFLELPITASLHERAKATTILGGQTFATRHYSALFVTPGVRLNFVPDSRLSPYLVAGAGLAHFIKTGISPHSNTNVIDYGGGLDVKLTNRLAFRSEVRDFYSGPPQLITGLLDREHQIVATGGIVFRF